MSDAAKDRARIWFKDPEGWSRSVASDVLALEQRVAALEASRPATPDSSPAADGEWRMLEVGTVQEAGDQLGSADYGWQDIDPANIGRRVGLLDIIRRRVKPATPAPDGDALRAECDRLRAENTALRQRLAAPIDVEAFRPEFEKILRDHPSRLAFSWDTNARKMAWHSVTVFADRLNAAARKEVGGE
jgi:hypothetical protein